MKIEMRNPQDLKSYKNNPRKNDKAIPAVMESIRLYGFRQPIVCTPDMVIVVGHTRWKAAIELGMNEVPFHIANLTDEQAKQYRIADNATNEISEWDKALLDMELPEINLPDIFANILEMEPKEIPPPPKRVWYIITCPVENLIEIDGLIRKIAENKNVEVMQEITGA